MATGLCGGLTPRPGAEGGSGGTTGTDRMGAAMATVPTRTSAATAGSPSGDVVGTAGVAPTLAVAPAVLRAGAAPRIMPVAEARSARSARSVPVTARPLTPTPTSSAPALPALVPPSPAVPVPGSVGLEGLVRLYLAGRPGHVSVAVFDAVAGTTVAVTDPAAVGYEMASSVKLDILTALVRDAGPTGTLTARQRTLARKMISVSDNDAANALWRDAGAAAGMSVFFAQLGMVATQADTGGHWGLTRTTAADQLAVLRAVAYPGVLLAGQREVIAGLLRTVILSQRWGLTGGVPSGVAVELKNGWLRRGDGGWVITSLAHVHGAGRDYVMAVYTKDGPSRAAGIATVQGLSALAWNAAAVSPTPG
ncbi:serine hydrolase [Frankia sp. AgPm24]|uniref:serine hydrolase n=1 Tax=Frankia sp. AgPm24 TaxID=631128 RepID=UPI0035ADB0E0